MHDFLMATLSGAASLAVAVYLYVTFVAPWLRERTAPDLDAKTRDLLARHRAQELSGDPDYLLQGEDVEQIVPQPPRAAARRGNEAKQMRRRDEARRPRP